MSLPIKFSKNALEHIRALRKSMNLNEDTCLRIGVKGGKGCMVVEKMIGFDQKTEQDEVYQIEDIRVLIRKGESLYIAGLEVDYVDVGNSRGFVFRG
ncbi:MAG: iron-sulfur cluster assembly accessory protein [Bacteroidetes bacterium]|nr:iron-sulfur cluster assembly accessory protein [Bacteroidota bacterium]